MSQYASLRCHGHRELFFFNNHFGTSPTSTEHQMHANLIKEKEKDFAPWEKTYTHHFLFDSQ